jgi:hypothetical protein
MVPYGHKVGFNLQCNYDYNTFIVTATAVGDIKLFFFFTDKEAK